MKNSLTFVIPTNNRPRELNNAVKSIADQIVKLTCDTKVGIVVIDNGSEESTKNVIDRFTHDFIDYRRFEDNMDYSVAFYRMMTACPESNWVWTFGDDDLLRPGSLEFVVNKLKEVPDELAFIHVTEISRWAKINSVYKGELIDLCKNIGWLEMTGFITGNICRGDRLAKAAETPRWKEYAKSSFVHSLALLEELYHEQAMFMDIPCVQTQAKQQTEECIKKWIEMHIPERYLFVSTALERMVEDGILTEKLPQKFFRYQTFHLWDRFLTHFGSDYLNHGQMWIEDSWANVIRFAKFVDDDEVANKIIQDCEAMRGMIGVHFYLQKNLDGLRKEIEDIAIRRGEECYAFNYLKEE